MKSRRVGVLLLALALPLSLAACEPYPQTGNNFAYAIEADGRKSLIIANGCGGVNSINLGPGRGDRWRPFSKVEMTVANPPTGQFTLELEDPPDFVTFRHGEPSDLPFATPFYVEIYPTTGFPEQVVFDYDPNPGFALVLDREKFGEFIAVPIAEVELAGDECD